MSAIDRARRLKGELEERRRRRPMNAAMDKALRAPPARAFGSFGTGTHVLEPSRVDGPEYMHLGHGVLVHELAWLIARPAPDGTPPRLVVEDGCRFNRFLKIVCTGEVVIGERCLLSDHVYISDTGYRHDQPGVPIAQQGLGEPHPVHVGPGVFFGYAVKVLPGVTIGENAYLGAGAVVTEDVPARGLVAGNPGRLLRVLDEAEVAEARTSELRAFGAD